MKTLRYLGSIAATSAWLTAAACGPTNNPDVLTSDATVGDTPGTDVFTPDSAVGDTGSLRITQLSAGSFAFTMALRSDGTVWAWGINDFGELGVAPSASRNSCVLQAVNTPCSKTAVQIPGLTGITQIASGNGHACALTGAGAVMCWGLNETGQLGLGTADAMPHPVAMAVTLRAPARHIAAGSFHTCAVLTDDSVWCWGANNFGQLAQPTTPGPDTCTDGGGDMVACSRRPIAVAGLTMVRQLALGRFHSCALRMGGAVSCWGLNDSGQLGLGMVDDLPHTTPAALAITNVRQISATAGSHTCAVSDDGTARCWGWNDLAQLGVAIAASQTCMSGGATFQCASSPAVVDMISGVAQISTGRGHSCATTTDGRVLCWGRNDDGQAGTDSSPVGRCSFVPDTFNCVRVAAPVMGTTMSAAVVTGEFHSCALHTDGSARCWGRNDFGQLGDDTTMARHDAVRVMNLP